MKLRTSIVGCAVPWILTLALNGQTPVLSSIKSPYPSIQSRMSIQVAGNSYGSGVVAYGPVGAPLVLTGSGFGASGTVQFTSYYKCVSGNGCTIGAEVKGTTISENATLWGDTMVLVTVPSGAKAGLVTITANGTTSNGLPFLVTQSQNGYVAASCPSAPSSNSQLEITTASLDNGIVNQNYSAALDAIGGRPPYVWSLASGSLPSGLSLSSSGVISGTPTAAEEPASFTVEAVDQDDVATDALLSIAVQSPPTQGGLVYTYTVPSSGYDGNGNLLGYTDSIMGSWAFGYDSLNRLDTGSATTGDYAGQYLCWSYDNFGNRTQQVLSSESFQADSGGTLSCQLQSTATLLGSDLADYNENNQMVSTNASGWVSNPSYDQSGDLRYDGTSYYSYDGDGRVCAVQTYSVSGQWSAYGYVYDAEGRRIAKGTVTPSGNPATQPISCDPNSNGFQLTKSYVLGPNGEDLTTEDNSGNWESTNVYAAGKLIGTYDLVANPSYSTGNGQPQQIPALHFQITDPLGTRRVQVAGEFADLGLPETYFENLPFGDYLSISPYSGGPATSDDSTPLHFTGKERDSESRNDYFGARYYSSSTGRFLNPDPLGDQVADSSIPQSWNLYAYAVNNPFKYVDPTGYDSCAWDNGTHDDAPENAGANYQDCAGQGGKEKKKDTPVVESVVVYAHLGLRWIPFYLALPQPTHAASSPQTSTNNTNNAPNNGPSYTHADVCAASAVLNKGLPTLLDALGMIPGEGTLLKGLQWGASILSGTMIDNPGDAALSGGGLGLMALDSGLKSQGREVTAKVFGKTVGVLPIAGILTSGYATYRDVYGTNGMNAYYDNCLAGKN